ncbi:MULTISPECIES: type VII toxin-antitoxin system HepT family RNase toxin [Arsenicicoccus]|uniref:type VII toxin-antitoxin system HepT family RNase toxin n=1 Tax=Arsenicicoccus TaxID=267408 RepID=UPI00257D9227|nr:MULTISPECIES: HepT-like ribonuclease domain-containing protein [Arsenicicoccus]
MPPRDLDDQVVVRRLTAIRELVDLLARQGEVSGAQLRDDLVLRLAVERALSQLVDLASDVNSHVVAVAGIAEPTDYRSSFRQAARAGLITDELARRLGPSVGLRDIVIHEYVQVDLDLVARAVPQAASQFDEYVAQVKAWLQARAQEPAAPVTPVTPGERAG